MVYIHGCTLSIQKENGKTKGEKEKTTTTMVAMTATATDTITYMAMAMIMATMATTSYCTRMHFPESKSEATLTAK
eukprot:5322700-Ditylum_brightwellii.AAC.1